MHSFLTDYHSRLEAFRTGALHDVSQTAAPLFVQPVALTRRLSDALVGEGDYLELLRTAHKGLVAVAGKEPVKTAHTFDLQTFGLKLRFMLTFARSREADAAVPVVTIGYQDEL